MFLPILCARISGFDPEMFLDALGVQCVIGGSGTDCLTLVREMSRKQESPPSFIFSKWKGQKHRKIPYRDCSRFGRQIIEREGVSTLSIHGYPWALRYLLICVFKNGLFAFQLWVLKSFFENSSSTLVSVLKSV